MAGINFGSNLADILEKDDFSLEELLVEDDLLQEIKSRNAALLGFLSTTDTITAMVNYVTIPAKPDAGDEVYYKFPYMSCEVFCSEIPSVLKVLVEHEDGKYFTKLLSVLDSDGPLNHYLAGYLEKILDMLFRQMTIPVMMYLNGRGLPVFEKFLKHVDNYSVMQIVQRLMLPHIPFSLETSDVETMTLEQRENCTCDWSFLPQTCSLLINRMLEDESHADIPAHISELLITVIQLSPPDAPFLSNLCEDKCLQPLVSHICSPMYGRVLEEGSADKKLSDALTAQALAVASVLDSLMSRMCEAYDPSFDASKERSSPDHHHLLSGATSDLHSNPAMLAAARIAEGQSGDLSGATDSTVQQQIQERVRQNMGFICRDIIPVLPKIGSMLRSHLKDSAETLKTAQRAAVNSAVALASDQIKAGQDATEIVADLSNNDLPTPEGFVMHQTKFPFARLGHHGFRLVKLIESVVRLADPEVDAALVASGCLEACIRLMFQYEMHSLLHLSVQRIAVMVIEGGENRRLAQKNILVDAGLLDKVISSFNRNYEDDTWNGNKNRFAYCGKPVMGHIIYVAQVLVRSLHVETPEGIKETRDTLEDSFLTADGDGGSYDHNDSKGEDIWSVVEGTAQLGHQELPRSIPATLMRTIIEDAGYADRWDAFVETDYKKATDIQLTGMTDSGGSVYSASDTVGSPDHHEDTSHAHMENALRALAGYSGFDGNLANRWPAADSDFVIISEEEDDDDGDDDYPDDDYWNPSRQGGAMNGFAHYAKPGAATGVRHTHNDAPAVVNAEGGYQNFNDDDGSSDDPDSDDGGSWTNVDGGANANVEDLFGPSSADADIFASEPAVANLGTDFFASSPASVGSSPGIETPTTSSTGVDFFSATFNTNISSPPASPGEDLFAQAGSPSSNSPNTGSDFFGGSNSVFSFSSFPKAAIEPMPAVDENALKGDIEFI